MESPNWIYILPVVGRGSNYHISLEILWCLDKMALTESFCESSFPTMENCDDSFIFRSTPNSSMEYFNSSLECPSLWPSLNYHQCGSDTDKEIWITMFDEETTMELFPTPPATPQSPLLFKKTNKKQHTLINFTTVPFGEPVQAPKRKLSIDSNNSSPGKCLFNVALCRKSMPLTQTFKNFKWLSIKSSNIQTEQNSVKRRLDL